jgi:hypothetical protein
MNEMNLKVSKRAKKLKRGFETLSVSEETEKTMQAEFG